MIAAKIVADSVGIIHPYHRITTLELVMPRIILAEGLIKSGHASPFEHQAKYAPHLKSRNFTNFLQYRDQLGI